MNYVKSADGQWVITFQDANGNTVTYTHPVVDCGTRLSYDMIAAWLPDPATTTSIFEFMAAKALAQAQGQS